MCTGLLASCICGHYRVLRWTTRCKAQCKYPSNRLQRVDFDCSGCDAWDQEILELRMAAEGRIREAARETNRAGTRELYRRGPLSSAEMQALRRTLLAVQLEKEKLITRELERDMERVTEEWRIRLEEARVHV